MLPLEAHLATNQDVKLKERGADLLPQTSEIHLYVVKKKKKLLNAGRRSQISKSTEGSMYLWEILKEMGMVTLFFLTYMQSTSCKMLG